MKFKKAIAWIFAFLCFGAAFVYFIPKAGYGIYQLFAPDMEEVVSHQEYTGSNYYTLSVKEKYIYGLICENHEGHKTELVVPEEVTSDEMTNVFTAIKFDFPSRGCLEDTYSFVQKGDYFYYTLEYWLTYDTCCERSEKCSAEAEKIVNEAKDKSDYEKALFFHDTLTQRAIYSYSMENDVFTAYGALFNGKANCSGFTAAMTLLLNCSGVKNEIVLGEAKEKRDSQENVLHVWNVAETEKGKGHIDVAWDAGDEENLSAVNHTYFYLSDEEILRDHVIFQKYQGLCPDKGSSYFDVNGTCFVSWTEKEQRKTGNLLADALESGNDVEIKFSDEKVYALAADYLFNKNGVYDLMYMFCENSEEIPAELTYYANDYQYTILIKLS